MVRKQWAEWRAFIIFFGLVLLPVKSSLADWNWVPTGSMNPTIVEGDLVYVNKAAYDLRIPLTMQRIHRWADPANGDIVVLFSPEDEVRLVKRVIGIPGDRLEMRNNVLLLNGEPLGYGPLSDAATEDLQEGMRAVSVFAEEDLAGHRHAVMSLLHANPRGRDFPMVVVPEGKYFVMGDNRDNSKDSRVFGFADREAIVGRAQAVIVSFNKLDRYQPRFGRFFSRLDDL
ncbi:MAG: signal peptidase I [Verrucomicrobiales bacterium]